MKISKRDDQASISPEKTYPISLRNPRLLVWMATPGSALEFTAVVGAIVVLGQLLFASITLKAAVAEFSTLAFLGLSLPPFIRRAMSHRESDTGSGDDDYESCADRST